MSEQAGRDWARIRTLLTGWMLAAGASVVGAFVALWCVSALVIGSAVMLHRILEWVV